MAALAKKIGNVPPQTAYSGCLVRFPGSRNVDRRNTELIEQYQHTGEERVLETILDLNQGLIHTILRRFSYFPDPYEDLVQVANLGLIKAVKRFETERGVEFSSYATAVVDGEVRHYLRDNVLMRQPRWLRKAEKNIEQTSIELTKELKRRPTLSELADRVNISEEGITEILSACAAASLHYVDDPINSDRLSQSINADAVHSLHYESFILPIEDRIVLQQAIEALSEFHKKLVYLLFYRDLTQTQVAQELGLNQRKISRESAKALDRLKTVLNTKIF